jgi:hypothetical protein
MLKKNAKEKQKLNWIGLNCVVLRREKTHLLREVIHIPEANGAIFTSTQQQWIVRIRAETD